MPIRKFSYKIILEGTAFVILTCLGIGIMSDMPYLSQYNTMQVMQGWILSCLIAWGMSGIFATLANKYNKQSMHEIIAAPIPNSKFKTFIKYIAFYLYFIQLILSQVFFAMILSSSALQIIRICNIDTLPFLKNINIDLIVIPVLHALALYLISYIHTNQMKRTAENALSIIKIVITCCVPLIAIISKSGITLNIFEFSNISNFIEQILQLLSPMNWIYSIKNIFTIAFCTIWSLSGSESVVLESSIPNHVATYAIPLGLLGCTLIYMFNTFVCFNYVNLDKCAKQSISPYMMMMPASQITANVIINSLISVISFGSMYGWFSVIISTMNEGKMLLPRILHNKTAICYLIFLSTIIVEIFKFHAHFMHLILFILNITLVLIYIMSIISFGYHLFVNFIQVLHQK